MGNKAPTTFSEHGGVYMGMDGKPHTIGEVASDKRTAAYVLWDHPLALIIGLPV